jgi:hypothetical protein
MYNCDNRPRQYRVHLHDDYEFENVTILFITHVSHNTSEMSPWPTCNKITFKHVV